MDALLSRSTCLCPVDTHAYISSRKHSLFYIFSQVLKSSLAIGLHFYVITLRGVSGCSLYIFRDYH